MSEVLKIDAFCFLSIGIDKLKCFEGKQKENLLNIML